MILKGTKQLEKELTRAHGELSALGPSKSRA
jgi:hypothetical protein